MRSYTKSAGTKGESYISGIQFILPKGYETWNVFVDIENPSKEKYRTEVLATNDGKITYEFTAQDLKEDGRLLLDLILVQADEDDGSTLTTELTHIYKPFRGEFSVRKAICASDEPSSETTTVITSEVKETVVELLNIYKTHDLGLLDLIKQNEVGQFSFNGENYVTDTNAVKVSVDSETLKITFGGVDNNG